MLDDYHLSEHFYAFAQLIYPNDPAGAKAWVDQQMGALLTDRVGEGLRALQRRPGKEAVRHTLTQLIKAHPLTYCLAIGLLSVTNMIRFVLDWWISRLPSRVGLMCLTMPA